MQLNSVRLYPLVSTGNPFLVLGTFCFTSTEARLLIRDGYFSFTPAVC